jgi:hypothetical protein
MAKKKTAKPAVVDTTAGSAAYALAVQYRAQLDPRLPAGTIDNLAADLTTLGAPPPAASPPAPAPAPAAPPAPTLAQAVATAANLVSAIHEAVVGAKAKGPVRKEYGVSSRGPVTELHAVVAAGEKIVARATANPAEALSLGVLPADVTALQAALAAVTSAEEAAHASGAKAGGATAKAKKAAEVRMHEATARIAGAGALAFAQNASVRAEFEALRGKKA